MEAVLVTGASGFVGRHVCARLADARWAIRAAVRTTPESPQSGVSYQHRGDLGLETDWRPLLAGVDAVVHLAARVHVLHETEANPLTAFRTVNMAGSAALARQAAAAGVRRFLFMSSIGARIAENGMPASPYQRSKWEAEQALAEIAAKSGLELVILRPPLVYGADAPGNVARLLAAVRRGLPLPLASIRNRRSVVHVENLADAVTHCLTHPEAPGRTLELSDGAPISTPELIRRLAATADRAPRLFPCPPALLRLLGRMTGHGRVIENLLGDLVTDDREIREVLGWRPPVTWNGAATAPADLVA